MAIAETAKLMSSLELDTRKFDSGITKASKGLNTLSTRTVAAGTAIGVGLERLAEKGLSALGGAIGEGIQAALTLEKAQAQTQAVIESTGAAAGVSAVQVRDYANALEDVTTVDDKTIQQAENLLLTFTNIGGSIFPQAAKAATDMAIAFNKGDAATADLDGAAIQLGKALNDPAAGFAALKKSGVSFSEAQIKILQGTNSLDKAQAKNYRTLLKTDKKAAERYKAGILAAKQLASQKLILAELDKEFGKAGAAAGTGFAADISRANDAIDDAKISIAQGLMPALGEVARELATTFKDPKVIQGLKDFGTGIGQGIKTGLAFLKTVPWDKIASSLQTAAGFARNLVDAFLGLPTWIQTAVITGWGLNKITGGLITDLASGLIKGVLGMTAGVVNINAAVVNGGLPGVGGLPGEVAGAAGTAGAASLAAAFTTTVALIATPLIAAAITKIITDQTDPTGSRNLGGKAGTATARGIPDWNNKALIALNGIRDGVNAGFSGLPGKIADDIVPLLPKTDAVATAILAAGAQRDAETSSSIQTLIAHDATIAQSTDVEDLKAKTSAAIAALDVTTYTGTAATTQAARTAGMTAASAAYGAGAGVEQAIRASRPIITVEISATNVTRVNVQADRGGERSPSRDGDGGGGPGQ